MEPTVAAPVHDLVVQATRLLHIDRRKARRLALLALRRIRPVSRESPRDYLSVRFLLGNVCTAFGEIRQGIEHYKACIRLGHRYGLHYHEPVILTTRAGAYARLGDFAAALRDARRARRLLLAAGDRRRAALALMSKANTFLEQDDLAKARETYEQTRRELIECGAPATSLAVVARNLARACAWMPEADTSLRYCDEAEEIAARLKLEILHLDVRLVRAQLQLQNGDWQLAYNELEILPEHFRRAGALAKTGDVLLVSARLHLALGLAAEAEVRARGAARAFRRAQSPHNVAVADMLRATALALLGRHRPATRLFRESRGRLKHFQNELWAAFCGLEEAAHRTRLDDSAGALSLATPIAARAGRIRIPLLTLQACLVLAEAHVARGSLAACLRQCDRAARAAPPALYPWAWERLWLVRGRALLALGRRTAAASAFQRSIRFLEQDRTRVASDELRIAVERQGANACEELAALHLGEGTARGDAAAYGVLQMARTAALRSGQAESAPRRARDASKATDAKLDHDREVLRHLYAKALHPERPRPVDRRLFARIGTLERRIAARLRRGAPGPGRARKANAGETREKSAPSKPPRGAVAVVEYAKLGDHFAAFIVTDGALTAIARVCSVAEVRDLVRRMRRSMQEPAFVRLGKHKHTLTAGRELVAALSPLYRTVFAPVETHLPAGPIVVIPSAVLFEVPFAALITANGFLGEERRVTFAPHRDAAFRAPRRMGKSKLGARALFGIETPELGSIREELRAIERALGGTTTYFGERATVAAFRDSVIGAELLHVASHAQFRADNPMWSALHFHDGTLLAWEIARMRLGARIAVLSACHTGRLAVDPGEEIAGLARGMLIAGVDTLVHSLWRVDDQATANLMAHFYARLAAGDTAGEALDRAMAAQRERYPHPYFWAAFALMGSCASRLSGT